MELERSFPVKKTKKQKANEVKGEAAVDEAKLKKYNWNDNQADFKRIKTKFHGERARAKHEVIKQSVTEAARSELLLHETAGYIEADDDEPTFSVSQREIVDSVDIQSAAKQFDLSLREHGPYTCDYTRNGRHLLLGGHRGHLAAFDWVTKKLHCEVHVAESVRSVKWLHTETMFAVAQRKWTYIYDNQGTELHCLKNLHGTRTLDFLPYHLLLVAATDTSYLHWLDVSTGALVKSTGTKHGPLGVMCQNPANAMIALGHNRGTVSMWSPNVAEPVVKMLCHPGAVQGCSIEHTGTYMATTAMDRRLRIWDLRTYKQLYEYRMPVGLGRVTFSARKTLAVGVGTSAQVFTDICTQPVTAPYLVHGFAGSQVRHVAFCPYEDVLGVAHDNGFTSLLVPGCAEPNVDALEANPFQSRNQRREREVKQLLHKIQPEMITMDTSSITRVDQSSLEDKLFDRAKILYVKPQQVQFTPKHKMKGKSSALNKNKRKQKVLEGKRKDQQKSMQSVLKQVREHNAKFTDASEQKANLPAASSSAPPSVLDRFKPKPVLKAEDG